MTELIGISPVKINAKTQARIAEIARQMRFEAEGRIRAIVSMSMLRDLPEEKPGDRIGAHKVHLMAGTSPAAIAAACSHHRPRFDLGQIRKVMAE